MRAGSTSAPAPAPAPAPSSPPKHVEVSELRGADTTNATPASVPATEIQTLGQFLCLKKSQIRDGFEMDSNKAGILPKGETIEALEIRMNEGGTNRVRFQGGWVSETASTGKMVLQRCEPGGVPTQAPAPSTGAAQRVETLKEQGMQYFAEHSFEQCISTLERAASLDSDDVEVVEALAFAKHTQTKQRQAEADRQSIYWQEYASETAFCDFCVSIVVAFARCLSGLSRTVATERRCMQFASGAIRSKTICGGDKCVGQSIRTTAR
jgi:hypothetical protein